MKTNPQLSAPYVWRGVAEASQKSYEMADADFRQAIKLNPNDSEAYLEQAKLRIVQQKIPEARTLLQRTLDL